MSLLLLLFVSLTTKGNIGPCSGEGWISPMWSKRTIWRVSWSERCFHTVCHRWSLGTTLIRSLSLSLLRFFLITKHDIHGYFFFFSASWLQRVQLFGPLLARPGGGSDRRLALFTFVASRCNLVNHVANGRTPRVPTHCAPQWGLIHI